MIAMEGRATGLNHVSVPAADLAASLAFYVEVLGLERIPSPDFEFPVEWLRCGDLQIHLYHRPEGVGPSLYQHFGLTIDDFMGVYNRVRALGVQDSAAFSGVVTELPDGGVQMYVRDPSGNLVELDHPDASTIDPAEVPGYRVLAEVRTQGDEARRSTLFLALREAEAATR
jgi:catechol 2,3-dioxygenase-like lactoylglutathione lyase family enzyme